MESQLPARAGQGRLDEAIAGFIHGDLVDLDQNDVPTAERLLPVDVLPVDRAPLFAREGVSVLK